MSNLRKYLLRYLFRLLTHFKTKANFKFQILKLFTESLRIKGQSKKNRERGMMRITAYLTSSEGNSLPKRTRIGTPPSKENQKNKPALPCKYNWQKLAHLENVTIISEDRGVLRDEKKSISSPKRTKPI